MHDFIAVQCFHCKHYQVSHKRKDGKFNCKICGNKQSVRKVIARSNKAADVRKFVQQINLTRGRVEEQFDDEQALHELARGNLGVQKSGESIGTCDDDTPALRKPLQSAADQEHDNEPNGTSRWAQYTAVLEQAESKFLECGGDTGENIDYHTDEDVADGEEFVLTIPDASGGKKRRRKPPDDDNMTQPGRFGHAALRNPKRVSERNTTRDFLHSTRKLQSRSRGDIYKSNRHQLHDGYAGGPSGASRWHSSSKPPRSSEPTNDFGDGALTTLGNDEIVSEEVSF